MDRLRHLLNADRVLLTTAIVMGAVVAQLPPLTDAISRTSMQMLGTFVAVILALLSTKYPLSLVTGFGLCVLALTQSLQCRSSLTGQLLECGRCTPEECSGSTPSSASFKAALAGFSNDVNWLVFSAFHLGSAVERTQLGRRVSLWLCRWMGTSVLGLGYAVLLSELLLAPFVPSNTARGGGIVLPIVLSIAHTLRSTPNSEPRRRGGEFLVLCGAHANLISSSLFPTGMAANPLVPVKAREVFGLDFDYLTWVKGNAVPGLFLAAVTPLILYQFSYSSDSLSVNVTHAWKRAYSRVSGGRVGEYEEIGGGSALSDEEEVLFSSDARAADDDDALLQQRVKQQLVELGPPSYSEWMLMFLLVACLSLWISQSWTGLDTSMIAFATVMTCVYTGVLTWDDVIKNYKCLDTYFWLGILIMMAQQLGYFGISKALGEKVAALVSSAGMSPLVSTMMLGTIYFFSMYVFSSLSGHIVAFVGAFLAAGKSLGGSPYVVTAILAYFSTLCGCLTNFSSGPVVMYYAQNYCASRGRWFRLGLGLGMLYLATYFTVGLVWWKVLGWW